MKYSINLSTWASTNVEFETDLTDPQEIAAAFHESDPDMPILCHQCEGGGRYGQNLNLGDEWEIGTFLGELEIRPVEAESSDES